MKLYEQPNVMILTVSEEDIVRASIGYSASGSGDSVSIKDLFKLG